MYSTAVVNNGISGKLFLSFIRLAGYVKMYCTPCETQSHLLYFSFLLGELYYRADLVAVLSQSQQLQLAAIGRGRGYPVELCQSIGIGIGKYRHCFVVSVSVSAKYCGYFADTF